MRPPPPPTDDRPPRLGLLELEASGGTPLARNEMAEPGRADDDDAPPPLPPFFLSFSLYKRSWMSSPGLPCPRARATSLLVALMEGWKVHSSSSLDDLSSACLLASARFALSHASTRSSKGAPPAPPPAPAPLPPPPLPKPEEARALEYWGGRGLTLGRKVHSSSSPAPTRLFRAVRAPLEEAPAPAGGLRLRPTPTPLPPTLLPRLADALPREAERMASLREERIDALSVASTGAVDCCPEKPPAGAAAEGGGGGRGTAMGRGRRGGTTAAAAEPAGAPLLFCASIKVATIIACCCWRYC
jgi:hypothetical protein